MRLPSLRSAAKGFTLIELLVVAPIAIIVIATLVSLMVSLVGDVAVSRERSISTYNVQDALDRIEQDARVATTYMPTFSLLVTPQGKNDGTGQFSNAAGSNDLIMSQYATTSNPYDASRKVVYYADQPYACAGTYTLNRPMTIRVVYFTKVTSGVTSLWRRVIVPDGSTADTGTTKLCDNPWQRNSCSDTFATTSPCQTRDEKMLDYVSTFAVTYYNAAGGTLLASQARTATSIKVSLTQTKTVSGESVATTGVTRASHINVTTDDIPATPNVYVYNPDINTFNNPILTTFAWDAVKNAAVYSVRYRINGGSWVNAPDQTGTQFKISSARPKDAIDIGVTSKNDMGKSTEKIKSYTTPVWTYANLENGWDCYQPSEATYPCPAYTITDAGMVLMRGLGKTGPIGKSMFTMPVGLRPHQQQIFPVWSDDDFGRVDIRLDGTLIYYAGTSNIYTSVDPVHYIAEGTPGITWTAASIGTWNNWSNYSSGGGVYGIPDLTTDSMGRVTVVGLLNGASANTCTGCDLLNPGTGNGTPLTAIYPGVASPNVFTNIQITTEPRIETRGQGAPNAWNSIGATYYPDGTNLPHTAMTLSNSWVRYSTGFHNAEYRKAADGIVSLRGLIKGGTVGNNIVLGTLPNGYCPSKRQVFSTVGVISPASEANQAFGRVDVTAGNGTTGCTVNFYPYGGLSNLWLSLEGIHFYQEY